MTDTLPTQFVELVYDTMLKSIWRKKSLRRFLKRFGVKATVLAQLSDSDTKRDWLDELFPKLESSVNGRLAIKKMAHALADQDSFPDLENWENSAAKIEEARRAVARLKSYLKRKKGDADDEAEAARRRKEADERRHENVKSRADLGKIRERLEDLAGRIGTQKAGYEFQVWFYELMEFCDVDHRHPYVAKKRQIDGSITVDGTTYLVELKFTEGQASVDEIDSLYKKVVSKSDNTMGIMVSISGYSSTAIGEASGEKSPLLLLDHEHLYMVLLGTINFADLVRRVRRHSSQAGEAYLPTTRFGNC